MQLRQSLLADEVQGKQETEILEKFYVTKFSSLWLRSGTAEGDDAPFFSRRKGSDVIIASIRPHPDEAVCLRRTYEHIYFSYAHIYEEQETTQSWEIESDEDEVLLRLFCFAYILISFMQNKIFYVRDATTTFLYIRPT